MLQQCLSQSPCHLSSKEQLCYTLGIVSDYRIKGDKQAKGTHLYLQATATSEKSETVTFPIATFISCYDFARAGIQNLFVFSIFLSFIKRIDRFVGAFKTARKHRQLSKPARQS